MTKKLPKLVLAAGVAGAASIGAANAQSTLTCEPIKVDMPNEQNVSATRCTFTAGSSSMNCEVTGQTNTGLNWIVRNDTGDTIMQGTASAGYGFAETTPKIYNPGYSAFNMTFITSNATSYSPSGPKFIGASYGAPSATIVNDIANPNYGPGSAAYIVSTGILAGEDASDTDYQDGVFNILCTATDTSAN